MEFTNEDYLKGIILFGLNAATYKMALAQVLLQGASEGKTQLDWHELASRYFELYLLRLSNDPMPQQGIPQRLTKMERIVQEHLAGLTSKEEAIAKVARTAFDDVVPRFQTIGSDKNIVDQYFYEHHMGKRLVLTDNLLSLSDNQIQTLYDEINARWGLLEGAFSIAQANFSLANDVRETYLISGTTQRKSLTSNIPFLSGYQGNSCFYCGEVLDADVHVDHVLPRQVVHHDEIWNLVLAHSDCNLLKADKLVGEHFIRKLIARNENIMGSNHPWRHKIQSGLGATKTARASKLREHYDNVKAVLGDYYWGGHASYNPAQDPFYRRLITVLNN